MQRSPKGDMIAGYIRSRNLPRGGHGFAISGALICTNGHAYESTCHIHCKAPRVNGRCSIHPIIDHGQVTEPLRHD